MGFAFNRYIEDCRIDTSEELINKQMSRLYPLKHTSYKQHSVSEIGFRKTQSLRVSPPVKLSPG